MSGRESARASESTSAQGFATQQPPCTCLCSSRSLSALRSSPSSKGTRAGETLQKLKETPAKRSQSRAAILGSQLTSLLHAYGQADRRFCGQTFAQATRLGAGNAMDSRATPLAGFRGRKRG